jgi:hypothetical protein
LQTERAEKVGSDGHRLADSAEDVEREEAANARLRGLAMFLLDTTAVVTIEENAPIARVDELHIVAYSTRRHVLDGRIQSE